MEVYKPKPVSPTIRGLIKTHKPDLPTCLVINWKNTSAYKLSRTFTQKINELAPFHMPST
jgi:hypothetical protein